MGVSDQRLAEIDQELDAFGRSPEVIAEVIARACATARDMGDLDAALAALAEGLDLALPRSGPTAKTSTAEAEAAEAAAEIDAAAAEVDGGRSDISGLSVDELFADDEDDERSGSEALGALFEEEPPELTESVAGMDVPEVAMAGGEDALSGATDELLSVLEREALEDAEYEAAGGLEEEEEEALAEASADADGDLLDREEYALQLAAEDASGDLRFDEERALEDAVREADGLLGRDEEQAIRAAESNAHDSGSLEAAELDALDEATPPDDDGVGDRTVSFGEAALHQRSESPPDSTGEPNASDPESSAVPLDDEAWLASVSDSLMQDLDDFEADLTAETTRAISVEEIHRAIFSDSAETPGEAAGDSTSAEAAPEEERFFGADESDEFELMVDEEVLDVTDDELVEVEDEPVEVEVEEEEDSGLISRILGRKS